MKTLVALCIFFVMPLAFASQKAKILSPDVEIYADADFDSDIIAEVKQGDTYDISDKTYGAFYRIKLKSGKIGYIVDYELDIEGKGPFKERDLDELIYEDALKRAKENPQDEDEEEVQLFGRLYGGPTLQSISYRENILGGEQSDNLYAIGYKNISLISWSILGAFAAPKYYAEKTGGSAKALNLWADFGFSNPMVVFQRSQIRFSGSFFSHFSFVQVDTLLRKYDMHEITLGLALELGWLYSFKKSAIDLAIKYYVDKSNYAGVGLSFLF